MRPALLITRPLAAAAETADAARAAGFRPVIAPLLAIHPLPFALEAAHRAADSLLFTSAETPALLAPQLMTDASIRHLPAWAVGQRTAAAVTRAGFTLAGTGATDGSALLAAMAEAGHRHILHPGGRHRAPLALPEGIIVLPLPVYEARPAEAFSSDALGALRDRPPAMTLLFSARTATLFAALADRHGLLRSRLGLVALSPTVAASVGAGWRGVAIATEPSTTEALAAALRLWQSMHHDQ